MAPTRKSKSLSKRNSSTYDVSPDKDASNSTKSKPRRKLSDKLGSQWSKAELERFYEAYRKYGKDWKKVATVVRNRSVEMVEALFNMNRAYLSLPDGTASVAGLIAMMTDHYNVLEESDSGRESDDAVEVPLKAQKRKRARISLSSTKEDTLRSPSIASNEGCLSLLKRAGLDGIQPHAVRKRTPRFPVSHSYKKENTESYTPPKKRGRKSNGDTNDDDVAHVAALALAEASQRIGSPQLSPTPYKKTQRRKPSPAHSWDRMPETNRANAHGTSYEDGAECSTGGKGPGNGSYARDAVSLMDMEGVGTVEVNRKGKKSYKRKMKVEDIRNNQSDDSGEACSGTEELKGSAKKGKVGVGVSSTKTEQFLPWNQKKRNKKLLFGDEASALDALHTLANLSLMLPTSTMESESSVQLREDKDEKSSVPEAASMSNHRDKTKHTGMKEKVVKPSNKGEDTTSRNSKLGRYSANGDKAVSETTQQPGTTNSTWKRKRKPFIAKTPNAEDSHFSKSLENEDVAEEENTPLVKGKRGVQVSAQSKHWKSARMFEGLPTDGDKKKPGTDLAVSAAQFPSLNPRTLPTKHQNRRKMNLKRSMLLKEAKPSEEILKKEPNQYPTTEQDKVLCLKEMLRSCLSSDLARRWCTFEWFYSSIDYPWFAKREFVEYLNHVGLGHIPRLTRVEWGVIRSSLGKPRRFSNRFLYEEREKLKQYRESVRKHYTELRTGIREGLPTDLARPLSVGQRVIAIHPKTREVHDGKVLTVDHDRCRIQFDCPEMGVEFVMDVDCMPLNPLENMPEALRRQNLVFDKFLLTSKEPQVNGHPNFVGPMLFSPGGHLESATNPLNNKLDTNHNILQAKAPPSDMVSAHQAMYGQPFTMAHVQGRDADIRAMAELNRALNKKEALLMELRNANNDLLESQKEGDISLKDSEHFRKHIATVLVQLKEASDQASTALLHLRQRNTYPANPSWQKPPANSNFTGCLTSSLDGSLISQESGSGIVEVVKDSRIKAQNLVDLAIKVMSSLKEGEDAYVRIGEALNTIDLDSSLDKRPLTSDCRVPVVKSPEQANGSQGLQSQVNGMPAPMVPGSSHNLPEASDKNEAQIPSDLITSCVATLLMIRMCTERQYPPADVAQIIDSAVTSLHPCCPQNLPIYREIQLCMGRIKTQMLALIPT